MDFYFKIVITLEMQPQILQIFLVIFPVKLTVMVFITFLNYIDEYRKNCYACHSVCHNVWVKT
jgi:hypothetical protein